MSITSLYRRSGPFFMLSIALLTNVLSVCSGAPPEDPGSHSERPRLIFQAATLWSPAVKSNIFLPLNTMSMGLMTGGLDVDLGVYVSYSFGNMWFEDDNEIGSFDINLSSSNQLSVFLLVGSIARGEHLETGVQGMIGSVCATRREFGSAFDQTWGRIRETVRESAHSWKFGAGARAFALLRVDGSTSVGAVGQYANSVFGNVWSIGIGVSKTLI